MISIIGTGVGEVRGGLGGGGGGESITNAPQIATHPQMPLVLIWGMIMH